jgi:hypothetical protein
MLELGASAGLNLNWDRFAFAHRPWGRAGLNGPAIPTRIEGSAPVWRDITIESRTACDQYPVDPSNPEDRLRLQSYIWADQTVRMERLNAALELAHQSGLKVQKADAAVWARQNLDGDLPKGTTVVYHSVFFQYPPKEVRQAIAEAIEEAGTRTTSDSRLAWVRFEPEAAIGGPRASTRYVLNAVTWNGSERHEATLADVDPHGRSLVWQAP